MLVLLFLVFHEQKINRKQDRKLTKKVFQKDKRSLPVPTQREPIFLLL